MLGQFSVLVSCHVIENQEIGFIKCLKSSMESGQPFIGFQLAYYVHAWKLEPLLNCSRPRVVVALEIFSLALGLGL